MGTHLKHLILLILLPLLAFASWQMDFDELWASAGGAAFSPLSIADCHLWLDAADAATVLHTSGAVTNWLDKSTAKNNAIAIGAAATRPTSCPAEQNGLCTIGFDGGDYLATDYKSVDGQTIFVVCKSTTSPRYVMGARDFLSTRSLTWHFGAYLSLGVGSVATIGGTAAWSADSANLAAWHYDGTSGKARFDGEAAFDVGSSGSMANTAQGYYIGTFNDRGSPYSSMLIGNIGEILIYKRVLTANEIEQVEAYLMDKWGL